MEYEIELKLLTNEQAGEIIETKLLSQIIRVRRAQIQVSISSAGPSGSFAVNRTAHIILVLSVRFRMPHSPTHNAAIVYARPMLVGADTPGGSEKDGPKFPGLETA